MVTEEPDIKPITLLEPWLQDLNNGRGRNLTDSPNYYIYKPTTHLQTTSAIHSFQLGTGADIFSNFRSLLESAQHEIILVTCFWARSETQQLISSILTNLSSKGLSTGHKPRVRICFSSSSVFQKLFHPQTEAGKLYPPQTWQKTFGLPPPEQLAGIDLQIKSIFLLPFCVMHPKFIIVDRKVAVLPSCNVSWEEWFEGAVTLSGPVVNNFLQFWKEFWATAEDHNPEIPLGDQGSSIEGLVQEQSPFSDSRHEAPLPLTRTLHLDNIPTIFLPSPHHRNPQFRLPWQDAASPPPTPLNTFILRALRCSERTVYIQTPNLTSSPVLTALLQTLERGMNVHIVTSARLMLLEQLVTAGTTTSRCINALVKKYQNLTSSHQSSASALEEGRPQPGELKIEYFEPGSEGNGEPQQSHFKCLVLDGELTVLGSGNLDRASWYTSQELGVAFYDKVFAGTVMQALEGVLVGRKRLAFDSQA